MDINCGKKSIIGGESITLSSSEKVFASGLNHNISNTNQSLISGNTYLFCLAKQPKALKQSS